MLYPKDGNYLGWRIDGRIHFAALHVLRPGGNQVVNPFLESFVGHARRSYSHGVFNARVSAEKTAGSVRQGLDSPAVLANDGIHSR